MWAILRYSLLQLCDDVRAPVITSMGCNLSLPMPARLDAVVPGAQAASHKPLLTEKQYQIVLSTWCKLATDISGTGIKFFIVVFKMYPHLRLHFPFDPQSPDSKKLLQDSRFRAHACRFMQVMYT